MIALLTLVPLLVAILAVAAMRRHYRHVAKIAIAASFVSFIMLFFVKEGTFAMTWFSVGGYSFQLISAIAPINLLLLFIVAGVGTIVMFYSNGFIRLPTEQRRFFVEMLAFEAAMMGFAMSGNFILLFVAWEFLSLTSYLLIQFWGTRHKAARSARKAMTTVLIGDIALLAAIAIFWNAFGTLTFSAILSSGVQASDELYAAGILLVVAIFTKSAQFPFSEWLPDAMEGPAPVSAYLHSSTMVKAGVFLAVVLAPLLAKLNVLHLLVPFGIVTLVLAALNASKEKQIKRVLAYSTVQELGIMIAAVGAGAYAAAIYLFFAQAFYKALLFFSAGSVMNATENEGIEDISGLKSNRLLYYSTLFGVLALGGFVPFDGFFSSVGIGSAFAANLAVYAVLSLVGMLTSFYIFRWFFSISKKSASRHIAARYEMQPKSMVYSAALMAVLTLAASVFLFYPVFPALAGLWNGIRVSWIDAAIETMLALAGFYIGYLAFYKRRIGWNIGALRHIVYNADGMNAFYMLASAFVYRLSESIDMFDLYLNDLFEYIGHVASRTGEALGHIANGNVNAYALAYALGVIVLLVIVFVMLI